MFKVTLPAKFLQRSAWDQVYIEAHEQSRYKLQYYQPR
jgi:hypothetical protein